jgi:hypothetical protein
MRLATACLLIAVLASVSLRAQESFPATHIARLDIVEPDPDAGTIGGAAIIAVTMPAGPSRIRVTVAPDGDLPDSLFLLYRPGLTGGVVLDKAAFPAGSSTLTTVIPLFTPAALAAIDSGHIWLAIHKRSNHASYVEGPVVSVLSAVAPDPSGANVVPPVDDIDATGHCGLAYDPGSNSFRYTAWWLDLSGAATAARIRRGPVGSNGPVVFEMPLTPGFEQSIGIWESPGAELRNAMLNGELYFEVATSAYPNGELRGQIYPVEGFTSAIEPANEVPPVTGSAASGSAYLLITAHGTIGVFNKLQGVIGNLSGPITDAHIHRGEIGQNGPSAAPLESPTGTTIDLELASGSAGGALSDEIVGDIRATRAYVDVHTAAHQDGEARGQLIPARTLLTPAPTVSVPLSAADARSFSARYDRSSGMIVITAPGASRIALHAVDGRSVRTVGCDGSRCEISAEGLPAGPYFTRALDTEGRVIGGGGVMVGW